MIFSNTYLLKYNFNISVVTEGVEYEYSLLQVSGFYIEVVVHNISSKP